jgi:hypothetical protein
MTADRRDVRGALLAFGFVLLLPASEAALSLPDETDTDAFVASFYVDHRVIIITLQLVGLVAAGLLAGYAARLLQVDRAVGATGLLVAVLATVPGLATIVLTLIADPASPGTAGAWNGVLPRADDVLFTGIILFGTAVAVRLRAHPTASALGALVAVFCLVRLVLEAAQHPRGPFESLGPITFILLIALLGTMSARGLLLQKTGARLRDMSRR